MAYVGEYAKFYVKRVTDISYVLGEEDSEKEYFMYKNEGTYIEGDKLTAFLFFDNKGRVCATPNEGCLEVEEYGFLKIADKNKKGYFLNNNTTKDIFLSFDDFVIRSQDPQVGDYIYGSYIEKGGQFFFVQEKSFNVFQAYSEAAQKLAIRDKVEGYIVRIVESGVGIFTRDNQYIYVHSSVCKDKPRFGELVKPVVIRINDDGTYSGSLIKNKEHRIEDDKMTILNELRKYGGELRMTKDTDPEIIKKKLRMSKSSYKRAIGGLYKERLITIEEDCIKIVKK